MIQVLKKTSVNTILIFLPMSWWLFSLRLINMDISMIASAPRTLVIDSSPPTLASSRLPRRPWKLPGSLQSWKCCKGKSHTCKTNTARRLSLVRNNSEANHAADDSHPLQIFQTDVQRRAILPLTAVLLFESLLYSTLNKGNAMATDFADMPALRGKDYGKSKMRYPDFRETESGLQYKDLRIGTGSSPKEGETVVVDWDGYTIGYYGRIFEARNKAKGGSFEGNEKSYFRFKVGNREVIPAFEEAITTMNVGCVRRIIVPPEIGYPDNDFTRKGPKPTTFSGQRALDFVLKNQGLIDKTLLFDIELLKISPA